MATLLKVISIPPFPVNGIHFVTAIIELVSQQIHKGGDAHNTLYRRKNVVIAGGRSAKIVTPRLDFANEAPGVRQVRDRLQDSERFRDQLKWFDTIINNFWSAWVDEESGVTRVLERKDDCLKYYAIGFNGQKPADVYHGRAKEVQTLRNELKEQTLRRRRMENLGLPPLKKELIRPQVLRESVS